MIGGGELKIDPMKMEGILNWLVPTNATKFMRFFREMDYLRKFIASFSVVATPLHAIIASGKSLKWENDQ
jgi:hypothetical protein